MILLYAKNKETYLNIPKASKQFSIERFRKDVKK